MRCCLPPTNLPCLLSPFAAFPHAHAHASLPLLQTALILINPNPRPNDPRPSHHPRYPNVEAMGYLSKADVSTLWDYQSRTDARSVKFGAWVSPRPLAGRRGARMP